MKHSQETKEKLSLEKLGSKNPNFGKPSWNKGIPQSPEAKEKNRLAHIGKSTRIGYKHSEETREKMNGRKWTEEAKLKKSLSMCGENSHRWISDRTQLKKSENRKYDVAYQEWRKEVKNRDNWKCKIDNKECCGALHAHHILAWRDYPELRYDINNGITLCDFHHLRKRLDEKNLSPYFLELITQ